MERIYLDHNATTPLSSEVATAMAASLGQFHANPASQHESGQAARRRLEQCRETVATQLDCRLAPPSDEDRILFTSGGTESNNLVLNAATTDSSRPIILSKLEHPSLTRFAEALAAKGQAVEWCQVEPNGKLNLNHLEELLARSTGQGIPASLISVMHANHESGVLQPLAEVVELARRFDVQVHSDATQTIGKFDFSFQLSYLDAVTFSAHKFHGPLGIGGLICRKHFPLIPQHFGGFQQQGLRPGTESVFLAVGMAKALESRTADSTEFTKRMQTLRDQFEAQLHSHCPDLVIHGHDSLRLPHVSNVGFPNVDGQSLFVALDLAGIDCSSGSACASGSSEKSPVLLAMGVEPSLVSSSFRFSFGHRNLVQDSIEAANRIIKCYKNLRSN